MQKLRRIFANKYLITGIAFAVWMLFFDRNDVTLQLKRIHELRKLQESEKSNGQANYRHKTRT